MKFDGDQVLRILFRGAREQLALRIVDFTHRPRSRIAVDSPSPKEYLMKTLLLGMVAAAAILGATSASAEYREVRIVRDWDHWHHPPWFRHFARWRDCRDITERRYRPDGTVVVRRIHRCD
jgi:hypothetical protein